VEKVARGSISTTRWVRSLKWRLRRDGIGFAGGRGILYYENQWGKKPLAELKEDDAVTVALRALDTAAEADTATGGVDRNAKIFPVIKIVSRDGIATLPDKQIAALFKRSVA
jgi:proteasome beta subunit